MKRYEQRIAEYERGDLAELRGNCGNGASDSGGYPGTAGYHGKRENPSVHTELQICVGA